MSNELARIASDDLARYRAHRAHIMSIELKPDNYNRDEIERAFKEGFVLWGEMIDKYDIPATEDNLTIDPNSGAVYISLGAS